jgi:hypothetical protein
LNNPKVFIGSSSEARNVAYAVQAHLEHETEPTVWDQGVFELSRNNLDNLTQALRKYDFGVFVLSTDDILTLRSKQYATSRDNVLFELGMFIGRLGSERTFFLVPRTDSQFRLPTDLDGITYATYNGNRADDNLRAALGPASNLILRTIKKRAKQEIIFNDFDNSVSITRSREEHYSVAIDMIKAARKRLFIIERTPVLLFGPRHYWYEKEYHSALESFAESTKVYFDRSCNCMYIEQDSHNELSELKSKKSIIENLNKYKSLEIESEGRFQFSSLESYYGSFMVADNSCSIWFKGQNNAISICKNDSPPMAETLIETFNRLAGGTPMGINQLLAKLKA